MAGTVRDNTVSQATIDYQRKALLIGTRDRTTVREDYANISGALETVEVGTLMGKVTATGKVVPCVSTAVDGSQIPIGIMLDELTGIAIAGTVDDVLICKGGNVNSGLIIFDGAETLATTATDAGGVEKSFKDWLLSDTNIVPVTVEDSSEFDV